LPRARSPSRSASRCARTPSSRCACTSPRACAGPCTCPSLRQHYGATVSATLRVQLGRRARVGRWRIRALISNLAGTGNVKFFFGTGGRSGGRTAARGGLRGGAIGGRAGLIRATRTRSARAAHPVAAIRGARSRALLPGNLDFVANESPNSVQIAGEFVLITGAVGQRVIAPDGRTRKAASERVSAWCDRTGICACVRRAIRCRIGGRIRCGARLLCRSVLVGSRRTRRAGAWRGLRRLVCARVCAWCGCLRRSGRAGLRLGRSGTGGRCTVWRCGLR
jgi:hypothetical protein